MEVDSEADSRQKLDQRKQEIAKQLRKIEEITTDQDQEFLEGKWRQQRRNDLFPEQEQMQKMWKL